MTDEIRPADPPKPTNDRAEARRLFAEAQECSAAADYAGAMRLLKKIPKVHRGSDYTRIAQQVRARYAEIEELTANILTAMKKTKPPDIVLPMVRRLVELKPGDEWANELRHRLETQEQEATLPRGRFGLGFGKPNRNEPEQLDDLEEELVLEPIFETDQPSAEGDDRADELEPIVLTPVRPPARSARTRTNGSLLPETSGSPHERDDVSSGDSPRSPRTKPPPLPKMESEAFEEIESVAPSKFLKVFLLILLFAVLAAISVAVGIFIAKGTDGLTSSAPIERAVPDRADC